MPRLFFIIFSLSLSQSLWTQSTDHVKYYILYDVSGSVKMGGSDGNLNFLTSRLLAIKDKSTNMEVSVELVPYGASNDDLKTFEVNRYDEEQLVSGRIELKNFFDGLEEKSEQYTHLHAALSKISINKDKDGFTSYGVFVITDGQLQLGDVKGIADQESLDEHKKLLRRKINTLNSQARPVFFIQSSQSPRSDFFNFQVKDRVGEHTKVGQNTFWLQSSYKLAEKNDQKVLDAYDQFLRDAHDAIIRLNSVEIEKNNEPSKLVIIADYLNLLKFEPERFEFIRDQLNEMSINPVNPTWVKGKYSKVQGSDPFGYTLTASAGATVFVEEGMAVEIKMDEFFDTLKKKLDLDRLDANGLQEAKNYVTALMSFEHLGKLKKIYRDAFTKDVSEEDNDSSSSDESAERVEALLVDNESLQYVTTIGTNQDFSEIPEQTKDRDLEESIVLGLTDYLMERTKQEAMFAFYENIYLEVFQKNSFLKDTLFYNFSSLIKPDFGNPQIFEPNLLLFKEAINDDFSKFPENLAKHPKIKSSPGGTSIYYMTHLITHLRRNANLEGAFEALVKERLESIEETTPLERSFLFTAHLIEFLRHNNLSDAYDRISDEKLTYLSELAAVWIASKYPDIQEIQDLQGLTKKIKRIYKDYILLRQTFISIQKELDALEPSANFDEYQEYKRSLALESIRGSVKLLTSGLEVIEHYTNQRLGEAELEQIKAMRLQVEAAMNAWFYIQDGEYGRAASVLIPIVSEIPAVEQNVKRISELLDDKTKKLLSRVDASSLKRDYKALMAGVSGGLDFLSGGTTDFDSLSHLNKYLVQNHLTFMKPLFDIKNEGDKYKLSLKYVEGAQFEELFKRLNEAFYFDTNQHNTYEYLKKIATLNDAVVEIIDKWMAGLATSVDKVQLKRDCRQVLVNYLLVVEMNDNLKKLTAIAGEVSTAKSAGDVSKALWKYALPVASYRAKRTETYYSMINAYVGGAGAYQFNKDKARFMLSAPVGLEFGGRLNKRKKKSVSLFVPILDVGNVINYQIKSEQKKVNGDERTFKIEKVLSPGAYLMFGVSERFPLSIGGGYQANPNRLAFLIAFDLPLLRLNSN